MKTDTVTIDRRYFEALVTAAELGRQVLCASIEEVASVLTYTARATKTKRFEARPLP